MRSRLGGCGNSRNFCTDCAHSPDGALEAGNRPDAWNCLANAERLSADRPADNSISRVASSSGVGSGGGGVAAAASPQQGNRSANAARQLSRREAGIPLSDCARVSRRKVRLCEAGASAQLTCTRRNRAAMPAAQTDSSDRFVSMGMGLCPEGIAPKIACKASSQWPPAVFQKLNSKPKWARDEGCGPRPAAPGACT